MVYLAVMIGAITIMVIGALWMRRRRATAVEIASIIEFNKRMSTLQAKVIEGHKHVR